MLEKVCPPRGMSLWELKRPGLGSDAQCLGTMEAVVVGYMYGWSSNPSQPNGIGGLCVPGEKYSVCAHACVCVFLYVWLCV